MSLNNGLGKVTARDIVAGSDTLFFLEHTAVRHGNGRDWWVFSPHYFNAAYYRYLLSPDGLTYVGKQAIATTSPGLGQACFSPDGQWYARFNWHGITPDSSFATFDLYRFDRCSGLLSDGVSKTYDLSGLNGKPGGVAFSPASRYLYVSRWDTIFQYDLLAPDIVASEVVVAAYDGFLGDFNLPTRFYSLLLAPDNRIYCCVANNNSRYLHVIAQPDSAGLACDVQQHGVELPVFNNFLLPNMPFYRLWEWTGSPCDTLGGVGAPEAAAMEKEVRVYPNPASEVLNFAKPPGAAPRSGWLRLYGVTGTVVLSHRLTRQENVVTLSAAALPAGLYFWEIRWDDGGRDAGRFQKIGP